MSEPYAAFFRFEIARDRLVSWLNAPAPLSSRWSDWRTIGGKWYFKSEPRDIFEISNAELAENVAACDERLRQASSKRELVGSIIATPNAPFHQLATYREDAQEFTAGTLTYSENLIDFMVFLAAARAVRRSLRRSIMASQ